VRRRKRAGGTRQAGEGERRARTEKGTMRDCKASDDGSNEGAIEGL
jgi:hypothetical protein